MISQARAIRAFYGAAIGGVFGVYFLLAPLAAPNPALWYSLHLGWLGGVLAGGGALVGLPVLSLPAYVIYGAVSGAGLRVAAVVLAALHYLAAYVALGVKVAGSVRDMASLGAIIEAFAAESSAATILNLVPFVGANVLYFWAVFSRHRPGAGSSGA